jgi:hypothetical protein
MSCADTPFGFVVESFDGAGLTGCISAAEQQVRPATDRVAHVLDAITVAVPCCAGPCVGSGLRGSALSLQLLTCRAAASGGGPHEAVNRIRNRTKKQADPRES